MTVRLPQRTAAISRILIALVVLVASAAACDLTAPENEWDQHSQRLARNRARWHGQGLQSYSYVMSKACECIPYFEAPSRVSVEGSVVIGVQRIGDGEMVAEELWSWWDTVEGLFDFVAHAIEEQAAFLEVEYDPVRGFPTRIAVGLWEHLVDDEMLALVSDFTVPGF